MGEPDGMRGIGPEPVTAVWPRRWLAAVLPDVTLGRSQLTRKIVAFNLAAVLLLVMGVLWLNPFRDSLVQQREAAMLREAVLVAELIGGRFGRAGAADLAEAEAAIRGIALSNGTAVHLFDGMGDLIATSEGGVPPPAPPRHTWMTDGLLRIEDFVGALFQPEIARRGGQEAEAMARALVNGLQPAQTAASTLRDTSGATIFAVARAIERGGETAAVVALTSAEGEIDDLLRMEREQVLQIFVIAVIASFGLSLGLASAIANPLSELAQAAEAGRDPRRRSGTRGRVRIPDLAARNDEIGRLSTAMRGMVEALYDRIDSNEQFAADVAHEVKNPLASLRSAAESLRRVSREDQRDKLLGIIDQDVGRLDRLVSDISNASRLDSELMREEEQSFDLLHLLRNLAGHFGREAESQGLTFVADLPEGRLTMTGLEGRMAQVFVNLIGNALSFCQKGDAVRLWTRQRGNRILVVVEDTGPGIPDEALTRIFRRFYSQRPEGQFGDHSGLGLAISKQIVEAHGGVIWAENIRAPDADVASEPMGARFVVGLPV